MKFEKSKFSFLTLTFLMLSFAVQSQHTIKFEIMHKSKSLGTMTASHTKTGDKDLYTVTSDITKQVLSIKKLAFNQTVEYVDGKLTEIDYKLHVNDELKKSSYLKWEDGKGYTGVINGKKEKTIKEPIHFTSIKLLFGSANGVPQTFSESRLKFRPLFYEENLVKIGKSAKKIDTEYVYSNNKLKQIYIDDFVDFTMLPVEE